MTKIISLIFITVSVFSCNQVLAQKPDYTGTWVLNLEKSTLQSEKAKKITKAIFIIKQNGDQFTLTRYHFFGEKKKKIRFKMTADGSTSSVKLLFKGKAEWLSDNLRAAIWNKGFSNIVNYILNDNKDELTADETFASSSLNYHNYWVFDKEVEKAIEL